MKDVVFLSLLEQIKYSFVSVINDPIASSYSFVYQVDQHKTALILINCYYLYTDIKNAYAKYELFIDNELVYAATQPIIDNKRKQLSFKNLKLADKLEILLKACSQKIIKQELQSHKTHMLKTFINGIDQNTH